MGEYPRVKVVFFIVSSHELKTVLNSSDTDTVNDDRMEKSFTNMNNCVKWRQISQSSIILKI